MHFNSELAVVFGLLAVVAGLFGPLTAAVTGLPPWAAVVLAAGVFGGGPLLAAYFLGNWAKCLFEWYLGLVGWMFGALLLVGALVLIWELACGLYVRFNFP